MKKIWRRWARRPGPGGRSPWPPPGPPPKIMKKLFGRKSKITYEYCTRCGANLTMQKGYSNTAPYWECRGCGKTLINPIIDDDIAWICDKCSAMLNIQKGFTVDCSRWQCTKCGYANRISPEEIYAYEDEYRADLKNPYKGLTDEEIVEIMGYEEQYNLDGRENVILLRSDADDRLYVKKYLKEYNISVYKYLRDNPVSNMPKIMRLYEGDNNLVVIEEYIPGRTLQNILTERLLATQEAVEIAEKLLSILKKLHSLKPPIIHRDIKPSNVILSEAGEVYLLDINVAKWYNKEEREDTRLLGTLHYAAPEQFGYGFEASGEKADIYSLGILLNVMITGKLPKEEKAPGAVWNLIEKCICLDADERYTDAEMLDALNEILR